jgi:acetyl-CoA C-acetyltransferase
VHDCFAITEYLAIDHLGLTAPGQSFRAVEDGTLRRINPSGGLIGGGHPVGATGVRMVLDAMKQVSNRAGACQLADARTIQTLNTGGSATTAISFVIGAS